MIWRTDEHQSVRRRQRQLPRFDQRRGAAQPVADLLRCPSRLAGGLRRSGPRCVSGLHRTELARYTAEESAREAGGKGLKNKPAGLGSRIGLDNRALPLTRGQLDMWLAQERVTPVRNGSWA